MSEHYPDFSEDLTGPSLLPAQRQGLTSEADPYIDTRPQFTDFGGLESEIDKLKEIGAIFANPEAAEDWDVHVPTGLLLCGPGGVGKTELVRAFSREIDAELIEVRISDIQSKWVGVANEKLRGVFQDAADADFDRVVIFFDELDGLFSENAGGNSGVSTALISEMKSILSSLRQSQPNMLVAASTNNLSGFDEALLRAGRFDVVLQIPKPNDAARASIFGAIICNRPNLYSLGDSIGQTTVGDTVDLFSLAAATDGMTGADIKLILHAARAKRLVSGLRQGIPLTPITQQEILLAVRQHRQQRVNAVD